MPSDDLEEDSLRIIHERNQRADQKGFDEFCDYLLSLPEDLQFAPKGDFVADIELEPRRWVSLGIILLQSRKITGYVQLADGIQGPPISSYLPYPVFQMATEIFLKGMLLFQYPECRQLNNSSYVDPFMRKKYQKRLGSKELSHDLLEIIGALQKVPEYQRDTATMRFLELVERIFRRFYFPPYESDKRSRWADSRYPKRVYDDDARHAQADNFSSYPNAEWVERLFCQMQADLDRIWESLS